MKPISSSQPPHLKAPGLHSRSPLTSGTSDPRETFTTSEPLGPWGKKPHFEEHMSTRSTRKSMGTGQKVALVAAGLAAGAGIAVGVMNASAPPTVQVQISARDARRAEEQFGYLQQVGQSFGGSLRGEPSSLVEKLFQRQPEIDSSQAVRSLSYGQTVFWYPSEGGSAIEIHDTEQLSHVTRQVRQQMARSEFERGIENLKEAGRQFGDQLKDELDKLGDLFRQ